MNHRTYSPAIEPLMQTLLATLADIDFAYERELEKIENSTSDDNLKESLRSRRETNHRERREPYVQQLAELHARIRRRNAA